VAYISVKPCQVLAVSTGTIEPILLYIIEGKDVCQQAPYMGLIKEVGKEGP
jgi:hypothetical protein